jgi:hypothetical protein
VAKAGVRLQNLRMQEAEGEVLLAELQKLRTNSQLSIIRVSLIRGC